MRKIARALTACLLILTMALLAAGCGCGQETKRVDLIFSHSPERWQTGAKSMAEELTQQGYQVNLQIFSNEEEQKAAMKNAIDGKSSCIVLAGGNDQVIGDELKAAKDAEIPIIAYDSLVQNTDALSYYVTFDNEGVGASMGRYIEEKFNLQSGAGPFTIEFLSGSEHDSNARLMHDGTYEVLKPYIDKGQLIVLSGKTSFEDTAIKNWDSKNAEAYTQELVSRYYAGRSLDIVVAASDGIAYGVIDSLKGYSGNWPFITGQDADAKALDYVRNGRMGFTIKKDSDTLNYKCVRMIKAVVEGSQPDINDVKTYNNGVITVPSYLCIPQIIDKDNIDEMH